MGSVFQVLVKILVFWNSKLAYKENPHTGTGYERPSKAGATLFYLVETTLTDYSEIMIGELGAQVSESYLG